MKLSENGKCFAACLGFWLAVFLFILWTTRACGVEVKMSWNLNPESENVTKYRIWRGIELLGEAEKPPLTIILDGTPAVLTITAISGDVESEHSEPLLIIPITVQESTDLKTWQDKKTIYREKLEKAFYRVKIVQP